MKVSLFSLKTLTNGIFWKLIKSRHFFFVSRTLGQRATWLWFLRGVLKTGPRVSREFLYVSYPPRIELWTLDENSKKENEKECVKAVLYIVILEYSLYSKLSCCIRFIQGGRVYFWRKIQQCHIIGFLASIISQWITHDFLVITKIIINLEDWFPTIFLSPKLNLDFEKMPQ